VIMSPFARSSATERGSAYETSVGKVLLKSAPSRITQQDGRYRITGMAWGPTPISAVEVKIDGEPWKKAEFDDTNQSHSLGVSGISTGHPRRASTR